MILISENFKTIIQNIEFLIPSLVIMKKAQAKSLKREPSDPFQKMKNDNDSDSDNGSDNDNDLNNSHNRDSNFSNEEDDNDSAEESSGEESSGEESSGEDQDRKQMLNSMLDMEKKRLKEALLIKQVIQSQRDQLHIYISEIFPNVTIDETNNDSNQNQTTKKANNNSNQNQTPKKANNNSNQTQKAKKTNNNSN